MQSNKANSRRRPVFAPARPQKKLLNLNGDNDSDSNSSNDVVPEIEFRKTKKPKAKKTKAVRSARPHTSLEPASEDEKFRIQFEWQAPERIWEPKNKVWYLTSTAVILALILISAKLGYFILIVGLIAVLMLWFVQGTLAPWILQHKITSKGIYTSSRMLPWEQIEYFWFTKKWDRLLLHLLPVPDSEFTRLTLLVNDHDEFEIFSLLHAELKYGDQEQIGHNFIGQFIDGEYLPISLFLPDLDQPLDQIP